MKNALVIGATEDSVYSMELARKYGYTIYAIDGNEQAKGLRYADYHYVEDINDLSKVFAITDEINPDIVLPAPIGHCLTTVGAVNDRYGLAGVSKASADICTDKYIFDELLSKAGLRSGQTVLYKKGSKINISDFESIRSFPLIVKPRFGSGSREVEVLLDKNSLSEWIQKRGVLEEDIVIERCVDGEEYGIDGAFIEGIFYLTLLRKKKNTEFPYRQCVGYISVSEKEDSLFWNKCKDLMQKIGDTIGFKNCIIHADIIKDCNENPFIIETSARPSGHSLSNYFTPLVTGVILVDEFIKYVRHEKYSFVPTKTEKMMIRFLDLGEGLVKKVPRKEDIIKMPEVVDYVCNIKENDSLSKVTNGVSVMGRGFYLLKAANEEVLEEIDESIRRQFTVVEKEEIK